MVESLFSKFKEDKVRMLSVQDHRECFREEGMQHGLRRKCWLFKHMLRELDEDRLVFLADPRVVDGQVAQIITYNTTLQTDDLDAYDLTVMISLLPKRFLWPISQVAEAVAIACYTQNRSLIRLRQGKTPYELLRNRKPDLSYLHVFGALCYPTNDNEDLGKLKAKSDVGIFIGYHPAKKAYQNYNRYTRRIMEIIHVDFDELTAMASKQSSSRLALHEMTPQILNSGLMPQPPSSIPFVPPTRND
nr:retrovirus-related Pol polyprotein from transposon TNT 1-94 [Tanacetum cinerariifolium]